MRRRIRVRHALCWTMLAFASTAVFLSSCAKEVTKQKAKDPQAPAETFSQFQQQSPAIALRYGHSLQVKKDARGDGQVQAISVLPTDGHPESAADPRLDLYFFSSLTGVTTKETLLEYLKRTYPDRSWQETDRFHALGSFSTSYPDPDNAAADINDYYFLSHKLEVYRVIVKPGFGNDTRHQILAAWDSLRLEM